MNVNIVTRNFELTINGETRTVEVRAYGDDDKKFWTTDRVCFFQKRAGTKLWAERVTFWKQEDGSYKPSFYTTILNRAGYKLVAWSNMPSTHVSQHNSAGTPMTQRERALKVISAPTGTYDRSTVDAARDILQTSLGNR